MFLDAVLSFIGEWVNNAVYSIVRLWVAINANSYVQQVE